MTTSAPAPIATISWQPNKHLNSGDRVWILTDAESYYSRYYEYSPIQELFLVGMCDLETGHVGFATFGKDIAYAIVKAGLPPPPWKQPLPSAILLHRDSHERQEKGRYTGEITLESIPPELSLLGVPAARLFRAKGHYPNAFPGIWSALVERATRENAIEVAVLRTTRPFSAGEIREVVGCTGAQVTVVLQRLVRQGKLSRPTGEKRGTRYQVAPVATASRIDWTG